MQSHLKMLTLALLLLSLTGAQPLMAQDAAQDGEAELEKAANLKLEASGLRDLDRVVELCESALEKGLSDDSKAFARELMVGTLLEAATRISDPILQGEQRDNNWRFWRAEAVKRLEQATELEPNAAGAQMLLARLQALPGGDPEKARAAVQKAMELNEGKPRDLSMGELILGSIAQDNDERMKHLNRAVELDSSNLDALRARATMHMLQQDVEKAVEDFKALLAENPQDLMAQGFLTEMLIREEKFDEALETLEASIQANPEAVINYMLRAEIRKQQGELEKALEDLNKAVEIDANDLQALLQRAQLNLELDHLDQASSDIERVLVLNPGLVQGLLLRSLISAGKGEFGSAARDMELLVKHDPENTPWKLQLAMMYYGDDRPNKALEIYEQVLSQDSDNFFALRGAGDAKLITGDHQGAIEAYDACLKQQPDDDHVLNNLAWVLATSPKDELRNGDRSVELGTKACEVTEYKAAHILSTLAAGYAEQGDFDKAIEWAQKAVDSAETDEQRENLKEELESYQNKKPWRELQEEKDKQPNRGGGTIDL